MNPRSIGSTVAMLFLLGFGAGGCATLNELAALRRVEFAIDRVTDVRLAGVRLDGKRRFSDLRATEVAQLASAAASNAVPLELILHVRAENPAENRVTARLLELDWKFFVEQREIVDGRLGNSYQLPPGRAVDVPLDVRFDALELYRGGARELFDLALSLAGRSGTTREIRLEARPTIETSVGPIQYPGTITIRRTVGG